MVNWNTNFQGLGLLKKNVALGRSMIWKMWNSSGFSLSVYWRFVHLASWWCVWTVPHNWDTRNMKTVLLCLTWEKFFWLDIHPKCIAYALVVENRMLSLVLALDGWAVFWLRARGSKLLALALDSSSVFVLLELFWSLLAPFLFFFVCFSFSFSSLLSFSFFH